MSGTLSMATRLLADEHGLSPEEIQRTHAGKDGALVLETRGPRWFRFEDDALAELDPARDRKLSLAGALPPADTPSRGEPGLELVSWRPGRRLVLRRSHDAGDRLVKGFRSARWEVAAAAVERVGSALEAGEGFLVPRIVEKNADLAAYEADWIPLERLTVAATSSDAFGRVGRALRDLQARVPTNGLETHGRVEELAVLDRAARRARAALGELPAGWKAARLRVEAVLPPDGEPVAVHRDLHDGQILAGEGRVALIDLDGLAAGPPLLDVANLTAHLELRALQGQEGADGHAAEVCGRALLAAVEARDGEELSVLRSYQATTFLRLALLYALRPRWAPLVPLLIRYADRCLDELALA